MARRSALRPIVSVSTPSMRIAPAVGSTSRKRARMSVDLPAPVRPQMPQPDCRCQPLPAPPPAAPAAIQIGQFGSLVFQGDETNYAFVTSNVDQLEEIAESGVVYGLEDTLFNNCMYGDQLKFLRGVANTTYEYSGIIHDAYTRGQNQVEYQD